MIDMFGYINESCKYCADYSVKDGKCGVHESCRKVTEPILGTDYEEPLYIGMYHYENDINSDIKNDEQFEVIWIIMVHNFGDYGTSPRGGWLYMKNKENILYFLERITTTDRQDEFISLEDM